MLQLIRTLAEFEELTLRRLATTVEEERSRADLLEQYIRREQAASKKRKVVSNTKARGGNRRLKCSDQVLLY